MAPILKVPFALAGVAAASLLTKSSSHLHRLSRASPFLGHKACSRALSLFHSQQSLHDSGSRFGRLSFRFGKLGMDSSPVRAVSDGGSGGDGGLGGRGGGSEGNGGGDERGGNNWSFFSWYLMALDKHPVLIKAITSGFLNLIGDLFCQLLVDQESTLDLKRSFIFTLLGFALVGPTLHFWYLSLSNLVTLKGASGTFLRLLLDQFVFSPIFIGVFLSSVITLEGRPSQVVPKLKQEWLSSVLAGWQLWIPFQFLNFQFVPQKFQVLAANFVALAWNVILSFKAHKELVLK